MTISKDDAIDTLSDEKILNLPSTSLSAEQAAELERRLAELEEDYLWEDDPGLHGLPLFRNLRLQREKEKERQEKEIEEQRHEKLKRSKHSPGQSAYEEIMMQIFIRFRDVAKRACVWGMTLLTREMEIRSRAIILDDGRHVYVDGDGFVDENGEKLTDASAVAEARAKKKTNSATAHELQVATRAHALADQERAIEQQASQGARDTDSTKNTAAGMTPEERTAAAAGAGEHAGELERVQSVKERLAKELLNANTASLAAGAGLPGVTRGGGPSAAPPENGKAREPSAGDGGSILKDLRKTFAAALHSTTVQQTSPSGLQPEAGSLKNEFSIAIAPPRNDNGASPPETTAVDSLPPVRSTIL